MTFLKRAEKRGRRFLNPVPTTVGGFSVAWKVLPQFFRNRELRSPARPLGPFRTDPSIFATPPETGLRVTWFGHSASLIEMDGLRILIDPVWEQRASPAQWFGPKRFFPPTIALEDLPQIDVILVSHDHYDHFGSDTIKRLAKLPNMASALWVTSLGVGARLQERGVPAERIRELDWTESAELPGLKMAGLKMASLKMAGLKITAWPARHFSGRGLFDRFTTLWSSFVLEGPQHRVYFGADTGLWDGLAEIAAQYDHFDLTMLEIGAFHPLWHTIHLGPDNAALAYKAMGGPTKAGLLMPIHWALFDLALHAWQQPMDRLREIVAAEDVKLWLPEPGRPTEVRADVPNDYSWYENR